MINYLNTVYCFPFERRVTLYENFIGKYKDQTSLIQPEIKKNSIGFNFSVEHCSVKGS